MTSPPLRAPCLFAIPARLPAPSLPSSPALIPLPLPVSSSPSDCRACPKAHLAIISNPVNSTVPIAAEILKRHGVYDPKRLFGVTTLDVLRANTFIAESQKWAASATDVTVVGGHAGITILPLLSQIKGATFTKEAIEALTHRIQFGGDEVSHCGRRTALVQNAAALQSGHRPCTFVVFARVIISLASARCRCPPCASPRLQVVKAKDGAGSATLSMAAAADRFVASLLRAMGGAKGVTECAFVESPVVKDVPFFSTRVELTVRCYCLLPRVALLLLLLRCSRPRPCCPARLHGRPSAVLTARLPVASGHPCSCVAGRQASLPPPGLCGYLLMAFFPHPAHPSHPSS